MKSPAIWLALLVVPTALLAAPNENARFALHVTPPLPTEDRSPLCGADFYNPNEQGLPCSQYTVSRPQLREWPPPAIYVVLGHADSIGVQGVEFGINYEGGTGSGIDPQWVTWTGCTDGNEYPASAWPFGPQWPGSHTAIRVTWLTCQNQVIGNEGVHVLVGALSVYAYSEASLWIGPFDYGTSGYGPDVRGTGAAGLLHAGPEMGIAQCGGGTTDLLELYPGDNSIFPRVHFGGTSDTWNPCLAGTVPVRPTTWGRIKSQYGH